MRAVRKITSYLCTNCMTMFPSSREAREHVVKRHPARRNPARRATRRAGPTSADRIVLAIKGGAKSAEQVQRKTRIPLKRVHSFLTYLRKQGRVDGYSGSLRARG